MSAAQANAAFAEKIRKTSHTINPDKHPHLDGNSLSSRAVDVTGLRPLPETLVEMMIHEAKALSRENFTALLEGLNAIEPTPAPAI